MQRELDPLINEDKCVGTADQGRSWSTPLN